MKQSDTPSASPGCSDFLINVDPGHLLLGLMVTKHTTVIYTQPDGQKSAQHI